VQPDWTEDCGKVLPNANPHDPLMRSDSTGTNYYYYPVELEE
jgi:hypothetical protein